MELDPNLTHLFIWLEVSNRTVPHGSVISRSCSAGILQLRSLAPMGTGLISMPVLKINAQIQIFFFFFLLRTYRRAILHCLIGNPNTLDKKFFLFTYQGNNGLHGEQGQIFSWVVPLNRWLEAIFTYGPHVYRA